MGRVGGRISFSVDGVVQSAKGEFEWNDGQDKCAMVVGSDGVHGHTETPQAPMIKGAVTITPGFDPVAAKRLRNGTVSLVLSSGHVCVLRGGCYTAEGTAKTGEGELEVEYQGTSMEVTQPATS